MSPRALMLLLSLAAAGGLGGADVLTPTARTQFVDGRRPPQTGLP